MKARKGVRLSRSEKKKKERKGERNLKDRKRLGSNERENVK